MWKETISFAKYFVTASVQVFQRTLSLFYFVVFPKAPIIVGCVLAVDLDVVGPASGGVETVALSELGSILAAVSGWWFRICDLRFEVFPSLAVTFLLHNLQIASSVFTASPFSFGRNPKYCQTAEVVFFFETRSLGVRLAIFPPLSLSPPRCHVMTTTHTHF